MADLIENGERLRLVRQKLNATLRPYASRTEFEAANVPGAVTLVNVLVGRDVYQLVKIAGAEAAEGDWTSGDGAKWSAVVLASLAAEDLEALRQGAEAAAQGADVARRASEQNRDAAQAAALVLGATSFATLAAAAAASLPSGAFAYVYADPDPLLNGLYIGDGSTLFFDPVNTAGRLANHEARLAALEVITIDSLSVAGGAIYELGQSITPTLAWVLGGTGTPTAQTIDGQSIPPGTQSYTPVAPITADKTYTLAVTDASGRVVQSSVTVDFRNRAFWGVADAAALDSAGVIALAASALGTARGRTMTITPTGAQYVFYAYPAEWGAPSGITAFGFPTDFESSLVEVTTTAGYTGSYRVIRLPNTINQPVTMVVS